MTARSDNGGPAFPALINDQHWANSGMTLRDYFAAKAMQGMQANYGANTWTATKFAQRAYEMADAMLAAREAK